MLSLSTRQTEVFGAKPDMDALKFPIDVDLAVLRDVDEDGVEVFVPPKELPQIKPCIRAQKVLEEKACVRAEQALLPELFVERASRASRVKDQGPAP